MITKRNVIDRVDYVATAYLIDVPRARHGAVKEFGCVAMDTVNIVTTPTFITILENNVYIAN